MNSMSDRTGSGGPGNRWVQKRHTESPRIGWSRCFCSFDYFGVSCWHYVFHFSNMGLRIGSLSNGK